MVKTNKIKDFIQLLIDAVDDDEKLIKKYDHLDTNESKEIQLGKKLTFNEIKANLKMFMLAGYESTSYALCFCFYTLATKKNEQVTLREEIDNFFIHQSKVSFLLFQNFEIKHLFRFLIFKMSINYLIWICSAKKFCVFIQYQECTVF